MKALSIALAITAVLITLILIGLFTGNATLASLACLVGWTPAMIFVGWAWRGAGVRVTVSSAQSAQPAQAPGLPVRRTRSFE
jgi:hypothetical protein